MNKIKVKGGKNWKKTAFYKISLPPPLRFDNGNEKGTRDVLSTLIHNLKK